MGSITHRSLVLLLFFISICIFFQTATTHPHFDLGSGSMERRNTSLAKTEGSAPTLTLVHSHTINPSSSSNNNKGQDESSCEDDGIAPCPTNNTLEVATIPQQTSAKPSSYIDFPGLLQCEPPPPSSSSAHHKYKDAHERRVKYAARFFCQHFASPAGKGQKDYQGFHFDDHYDHLDTAPIVKALRVGNSFGGIAFPLFGLADEVYDWHEADDDKKKKKKGPADVYELKIEHVEGCEPPEEDSAREKEKKLKLAYPLPHHSCKHILPYAWKLCNNAGRGGSLQAACQRYSIRTVF